MKPKRILPGLFLLSTSVYCAGSFGQNTTVTLTTSTTAESISPPPPPGRWQNVWIDRVKMFIDENATLNPTQRHIVFVGDSLTQGFKLKEHFPTLPVLNRGIGSDGVCDFPDGRSVWRGVTRRLKESIYDCHPSHLFFLIGTNDVGTTSIPLDYWFGAYKYVLGKARERVPDLKIILITCPPAGPGYARRATLNPRIAAWNELVRKHAAEEGYRLIDLHSLLADKQGELPSELSTDGLHFNQVGFERWAASVQSLLQADGVPF